MRGEGSAVTTRGAKRSPAGRAGWVALAVAVPLGVYVATLTPTVLDGDAADFARQCHRLGLAHAPGYPLVGMVGKVVTTCVFFGDAGWRANLVGALAAAACLALGYALARRWGAPPVAAAAAMWVLAFSPLFWSQALFVNPYILGVALALGELLLLAAWSERRGLGLLAAAAALYGLGMGCHPSLALYLPAVAVFVLARLWRDGWRRIAVSALVGVGAAALGCLPWLGYMAYYVSQEMASAGHGVQESLGWLFHPDESASDWRDLALGVFSKGYARAVISHGLATLSQFSVAGLGLALVGAWALWRRSRPTLALVALGYLAQANFACTLKHWHAFDVYRLPTYALLALLVAVGLAAVVRRVRRAGARLAVCGAAVALSLGPPYATLAAMPGADGGVAGRLRPQAPFRWAFARENRADCAAALERAAPGSTMLTTWGPFTTCRFLRDVEGVGPGVRLVAADPSAEALAGLVGEAGPRPEAYVFVRGRGVRGELRKWVEPQPTFVGTLHTMYRVAAGPGAEASLATSGVHPRPLGEP